MVADPLVQAKNACRQNLDGPYFEKRYIGEDIGKIYFCF